MIKDFVGGDIGCRIDSVEQRMMAERMHHHESHTAIKNKFPKRPFILGPVPVIENINTNSHQLHNWNAGIQQCNERINLVRIRQILKMEICLKGMQLWIILENKSLWEPKEKCSPFLFRHAHLPLLDSQRP